jgi:hypothetical protein
MYDRQRDFSDEKGARELALRIERYWKERGFTKVMAAPTPTTKSVGNFGAIWGVTSNIGRAGPPA